MFSVNSSSTIRSNSRGVAPQRSRSRSPVGQPVGQRHGTLNELLASAMLPSNPIPQNSATPQVPSLFDLPFPPVFHLVNSSSQCFFLYSICMQTVISEPVLP